MVRAVLVVLCALFAADRVKCAITMCSAKACFTLHTHMVPFEQANTSCYEKGGYLVTIKDDFKYGEVKSLLGAAGELSVGQRIWIGLKLSRGRCVLSEEKLHGFRWITGATDSSYSNWKKEPESTCTKERCVMITSSDELKWSDRSCKDRAYYMCMFYFKGMCKPLLLAGPGQVNYTLPFSEFTLGMGFTMLPHATQAEINCASDQDGTNHYAMCKEKGDVFMWEPAGPFCASGQRTCNHKNGGCDQLCVEMKGSVHCACKDGYGLGNDRVTCVPKDKCLDSLCEHACVSTPTGFACVCPNGFALSTNKRSCVDVDECSQDVCDGHICHNRPGSYECECKIGFNKVSGKCEDVDECEQSQCAQMCLNSQGSFFCYCLPGFKQHGRDCLDIDECLNRPCEGLCNNTIGSYTCFCNTNFHLADNGVSCVQDQSQEATTPDFKGSLTEALDQSLTSTVGPRLSTNTTAGTHHSVRKNGSKGSLGILVYVMASVIPLGLLILVSGVVVIYRWNRSCKKTKKKSVPVDSYCWVSSAYTAHLETERNRIY
ncbi:complement component C1q receptor [Trichomycterus rosablanca]|uniref:complement component C1q receptor n=1 Tax=Trichomycterus rosablanca TaxID=2290929 RepID=UPI002F35A523